MKQTLYIFILFSLVLTSVCFANEDKIVKINNIQLGFIDDQRNIVGMTITNAPWQKESDTQNANTFLVCNKGLYLSDQNNTGALDPVKTEPYSSELTKQQSTWLRKYHLNFDYHHIKDDQIDIECLAQHKIKMSTMNHQQSFQLLLNSLTTNAQTDYPFFMNIPPLTPEFFRGKAPSQLVPEYFDQTNNGISFMLGKQSGATALSIITTNKEIYAFQVICTMHCAPVANLHEGISVYANQDKHTQWIMHEAQMHPFIFDNAKPVEISISTANNLNHAINWQHLVINYKEGSLIYWRDKNIN